MSFDLFFCRADDSKLDFREVREWAKRYPQFKQEHEQQLWYQSADTGVYFSLDDATPGASDAEESLIPSGYSDVGLSFNLNYIRPSFFALEAMPVVEELGRAFSLLVMDPQGEERPTPPQAISLIASWMENNRSAIGALSRDDEEPRLYMPEQRSLGFWSYMVQWKTWEDQLQTQDVFVPRMFLLCRKGGREVVRVISWAAGVHMLVPQCDWVAVTRPKRKRFWQSQGSEIGLVPFDTLRKITDPYMEEFDRARNVSRLRPEHVEPVGKLLHQLTFELRTEDFEGVAPDGFVDLEPS